MKKIFLTLFLIIFAGAVHAEEVDFEQTYRDLEVPSHSYIHDMDPGEFYDIKHSSWSPYPLLRLTAPIFFKTITIEPGYYLLTPREYEGNWYMLFKVQGKIKYIIPVYNRDITPEFFYDENIPKQKMTFSQRVNIGFLNGVGKYIKSSKREPAPQTYLELYDLDNNFLSMVMYWGAHKYYMIFRTVSL